MILFFFFNFLRSVTEFFFSHETVEVTNKPSKITLTKDMIMRSKIKKMT